MKMDILDIDKSSLMILSVPPIFTMENYRELNDIVSSMNLPCKVMIIPDNIQIFNTYNIDDDSVSTLTEIRDAINLALARHYAKE